MTNEALSANSVTENCHILTLFNQCWRSTTIDIFAGFNAPPLFFQFNIRIYCAIEIEPNFAV